MADDNAPASVHADHMAACATLAQELRAAAYRAWAGRREKSLDSSIAQFDKAYLGHYSHIDHYVETLVDSYQLDARLDTAIGQPYRQFVDIDVTALAQSLVRSGELYALPAIPVGVWIFNAEMV